MLTLGSFPSTGWISENRVNGNLALSRALGDFVFKRNEKRPPEDQIVTAVPDIEMRKLTDGTVANHRIQSQTSPK